MEGLYDTFFFVIRKREMVIWNCHSPFGNIMSTIQERFQCFLVCFSLENGCALISMIFLLFY